MKDTTQADFRACFSTAAGRRTLGKILIDGGYFDTDLTRPEEVAVQNFVKLILKNCGFVPLENIESYINKLFELPVKGMNNE